MIKNLLFSGLEEIARWFEDISLRRERSLHDKSTSKRWRNQIEDWIPVQRCVMCEVGQKSTIDKDHPENDGQTTRSIKSPPTNGQPPLMQCLMNMNYEMFAYMNALPLMNGGMIQPGSDWTSILNLAATNGIAGNKKDRSLLPFSLPRPSSQTVPPPPPPVVRVNGEKPNVLDLSRKTGLHTVSVDAKKAASSLIKISKAKGTKNGEATSVKPTDEGKQPFGVKRNYTQVDLEKAVNDIRCGRLGTRRASVVYGIPRSTLRNKIYKLEAADEQAGVAPPYKRRKAGGQSSAEKMMADVVEMTTRSDIPPKQQLEAKTLSPSDSESTSPTPIEVATPQMIEPKEELNEEEEQELVQATFNTLLNEAKKVKPEPIELTSPIPSLVPPQNEIMPTIPTTGADLISQVWQTYFGRAFLPHDFLMNSLLLNANLEHTMHSNEHSESASKQSSEEPQAVSPSGIDWKKQRPKRGQYRKYDKEALDEAVQSVRRGEMSVHRAGSYYGVPHSTLEYKVKERNLSKPKTKEDLENLDDDSSSSPSPSNDDQPNDSPVFSPQATPVM